MTRSAPRTRRRRAGLAVTAAAALLALAGCGQVPLAGSAAVVGDQRITDTQVADAATAVTSALGGRAPDGDTPRLNRAIVTLYVQSALLGAAAQKEGIVVTTGRVAEVRDELAEQNGGPEGFITFAAERSVPPSGIDVVIRNSLEYQALAEKLAPDQSAEEQGKAADEYLAALSRDLGTEVSPRFGTWDAAKLTVGSPPDDLSSPIAATPIPLPQAS